MSDYKSQSQKYIELRKQGMGAAEALAQAFPGGLQKAQAESLAEETNDAALGQILGITGGAIGAKGVYDLVTNKPLWGGALDGIFGGGSAAAETGIALGGESGAVAPALTEAGFGGGDVAVAGLGMENAALTFGLPAAALAIALGPQWAPQMAERLQAPASSFANTLGGFLGGRSGEKVPMTAEAAATSQVLGDTLGEQFQGLSPEQKAQVAGQLMKANALVGTMVDPGHEGEATGDISRGVDNYAFFPHLNLPNYSNPGQAERALLNLGVSPDELVFKRTGVQGREKNVLDTVATYSGMGLDRLGQVFGDTVYGDNIRAAQSALAGALGGGMPSPQAQPEMQPQAVQRPLIQGGANMDPGFNGPTPEWLQNYYRDNPEDYQNRGTSQLNLGAALLGL